MAEKECLGKKILKLKVVQGGKQRKKGSGASYPKEKLWRRKNKRKHKQKKTTATKVIDYI